MAGVSYIPLTMPFLSTLARGLIQQAGEDRSALQSLYILLPTRRAVRTLTDLFLDLTDGAPLLLPRMQAVADVDDQELELLVSGVRGAPIELPPAVTPLERQLVLTELIRARSSQNDYAQAAGLAQALGSLMDRVQSEGLSLGALEGLVAAEFAGHWQMTLKFLEIIQVVWPSILAERGKVDPGDRRNILLAALSDHWRDHPPKDPVMIAGVSGSLPAVATLMDVVRALPQGQVILSGFDPEQDDRVWMAPGDQHPLADMADLLSRFSMQPQDVTVWPLACVDLESGAQKARRWMWRMAMLPADQCEDWAGLRDVIDDSLRFHIEHVQTALRVIEVDNRREEALAIALCVRKSLEDQSGDIAIITPDRQLAQDIVMACSRFGVVVSDSAGETLMASAPGLLARLSLQVVEGGFHPVDVLALLQHPLCRLAEPYRHIVQMMDRQALRGIRPGRGFDEFYQAIFDRMGVDAEKVRPLLDAFRCALEPLLCFEEGSCVRGLNLVQAHIFVLERLSKSCGDDPLESEDPVDLWRDEAGQALASLFGQLIECQADLPDLSLRDYQALLSQMMVGTLYNQPDRGMPRVRVLGVYEARLTRADHVVLAGFNEGLWPSEAKADPWMSRTMQRDFGLPSIERAVGRMCLDVVQLVTAPYVTITRSSRLDGDPTIPSRWLRRLDTVLQALDLDPEMIRDHVIPDWVQQLDKPEGGTQPCERPCPAPPVSLRPQEVYATQLETLMRDPYEFYAERILRLRALDEFDEDPDQRLRGQIVHATLQEFTEQMMGDLSPDSDEVMVTILGHVLQTFLPDPVQQSMLRPRIEHALRVYLTEWEQSWRETGARPYLLESTWGRDFLLSSGVKIGVRARLDRLDRTLDGQAVIIDYKTSSRVKRKNVACGISPQLPIEVLLVEGGTCVSSPVSSLPVAGIGIWPVKARDAQKLMWYKGDSKYDLTPLIENADKGLQQLLEVFSKETTPYLSQPDPDRALSYPRYTHLSRVDEWGGSNGEGDDE